MDSDIINVYLVSLSVTDTEFLKLFVTVVLRTSFVLIFGLWSNS